MQFGPQSRLFSFGFPTTRHDSCESGLSSWHGRAWMGRFAPWVTFWLVMAISFAATAYLTDEHRLGQWGWYVMAQANVLLILSLEIVLPREPSQGVFHDRQGWNDIAHMILFKLVFRPLSWGLAFVLVMEIAPREEDLPHIWPTALPVIAQFVLLLLVFDLMGYAYHRALHRYDCLFAFHALHHDTPQMHVLKANRLHFGESAVNFLIMVPPMMLVGVPAQMMIWLGMWEVFEGNLAHSNLDQRFPSFFYYLVRTADVHRIHHSREHAQQNSNFGGLPIWDVLFGTFRHPARTTVAETGILGDPVPRNWLRQLLFPFRELVGRTLAPAPKRHLDGS